MRRAYERIPIYTADVSGVCSALYELGGMTVMHDPSGCNSTYNTHDETRWYDQDSLIFISGLTERDAIMGDDQKFLRDVLSAARQLHPRFIALTSSPIPFLNGTDFPALARLMEKELGIPAFFVPTSGMHDYVHGAGLALEAVARRLEEARDPVSAAALAREFSVSRQIIVGDVALLRAGGMDIAATPRGYVLPEQPAGLVRTLACRHSGEQMESELNAIVDQGCTVVDVIVEHPIYGQLAGPLALSSRYDVAQFVERCRKQSAAPLSLLTEGIHLHTVSCPDEGAFQRVRGALKELGVLLEG